MVKRMARGKRKLFRKLISTEEFIWTLKTSPYRKASNINEIPNQQLKFLVDTSKFI